MADALRRMKVSVKGLIFTYALVALGTFGAFRTPLIALSVYVAFAILRPYFLWGYGGNMSNISLYVGAAMLIAWVMHGTASWKFDRGRGIVASFLFFGIWATLSASQAAASAVAWDWVISLWKFLLPFMVGVTMIREEKWARRMLWVIVLSQGYVAWEMNLAYLQGVNRVREFGFGGMDNNSVGIAMVSTLGPALALVAVGKTWTQRGVAAAASLFILHATLLTFSRGAMLGLVVVGATAFIILPKRPKQLALVAVALIVTLRLTGPELLARYDTAFADEEDRDESAGSRVNLWQDCLTVALANPMFGIGPNHWPLVAASFGWTPFKSAHSVWMQTAAELGFPGVISLFLIFALTFIKLWPMARTRSKDPPDRERAAIATGIMLSAVGYAVSGQFVSLTGLEVPYYLAMVGVGMLITVPRPAARTVMSPVVSALTSRTAQRPTPAPVPPSPRDEPGRREAPSRPQPAFRATRPLTAPRFFQL
jgi:probable O-glycosylation ligase (exosortase A-associated)